jgi:hypothetical protein
MTGPFYCHDDMYVAVAGCRKGDVVTSKVAAYVFDRRCNTPPIASPLL